MKNTYWARFFRENDGRYSVDVPDLPGCLTDGENAEKAYHLLINEAIPLWLENQPWPEARGVDEVLAEPGPGGKPTALLVRVSPQDLDRLSEHSWAAWSSASKYMDISKH